MSAICKNNTHLQQNPERIPNIVPVKLLEALSAIPTLKQKCFANGSLREALLELASLAGEDDRREGLENAKNGVELVWIRILRELKGLLGFPRFRRPIGGSRNEMGGRRRRNGGGNGPAEIGGIRGEEMGFEEETFGDGSCRSGGRRRRKEIGNDHDGDSPGNCEVGFFSGWIMSLLLPYERKYVWFKYPHFPLNKNIYIFYKK